MNRFVTTKGSFSGTLGSGSIVTGSAGSALAYNFDGTRATMVDASSSEAYTYTADGLIAKATIGGVQRASYAYDTMGRLLNYSEYDSGGSTVVYSRDAAYDAKSQVTSDIVMNKVGSTVTTKTSTYDFTAAVSYNSTTHLYTYGGAYQGGVVTHIATTTVTGSTTTHQDSQNTFQWYDSALESAQLYMADTSHPTVSNTNQYYRDSTNTLDNVVIADGHPRTVQFLSNAVGQILKRDENASGSTNTPHELRYSFNNQIVGYVSNNGTSDTDYAAAITQHTTATGTGYYRNGATSATSYADFDQSYEPLNGNALDSSAGSYTVMQGDSLQSIAASVWGDSSLWYLIADANGMTAGSSLTAGQTVSIPNRVHNVHNNASTFKVYDPNSAIGDVAPSVPKTKNNACGVFGQILQTIIAIVVTIVTAPFAGPFAPILGDLASQVFGLATGIQKSFNWKELAITAITAGVDKGLGFIDKFIDTGSKILNGVIHYAASNAITQGISVAVGLQKKFDWTAVAASAIGGGVAAGVGELVGYNPSLPLSNIGNDVRGGIANFAGSIANAATRSLLDGTDFGDNIIAALPNTIGNTLGNIIGGQLTEQVSSQSLGGPNNAADTDDGDFGAQQAGKYGLKSIPIRPVTLNPGALLPLHLPTISFNGGDAVGPGSFLDHGEAALFGATSPAASSTPATPLTGPLTTDPQTKEMLDSTREQALEGEMAQVGLTHLLDRDLHMRVKLADGSTTTVVPHVSVYVVGPDGKEVLTEAGLVHERIYADKSQTRIVSLVNVYEASLQNANGTAGEHKFFIDRATMNKFLLSPPGWGYRENFGLSGNRDGLTYLYAGAANPGWQSDPSMLPFNINGKILKIPVPMSHWVNIVYWHETDHAVVGIGHSKAEEDQAYKDGLIKDGLYNGP